ncbi:MAG TPA: L,D-transpeptidase [Roseiarcus sp.]|nr:L,D-transpeptidase [Roseiarcus sp.]
MRKASRRAVLASVGLFALGSFLMFDLDVASAAQRIVVIPGVAPADAAETAPLPAVPPAPPVKGAYGGGFIEFLITGNSGGEPVSRPAAASSSAPVYGPPPAPAYANQAVANLQQPTPGSEPDLAVGRDSPPPEFHRQEVAYDGTEKPGTIVIDTPRKFLFLVEPGGRAIRYGIGVGRPGFEWSGVKRVTRKAEWPGWTPPPQMLLRRPDLPAHMDGGLGNPLGARALYLGSSLYRIHGTNEPWTIGQNVSSGCIRMMNRDVIDLYNRVPVGAKVVVL